MIPTRIGAIACALLCFLAPAGAWGQDDLRTARTYFERAQSEGIPLQESMEWLERSIAAFPTFRAAYELGKLYREAADHERALARFEDALDLTDRDKYLAQAAYQIGVTHERMAHYVEARRWLRKSLSFSDHEAVRRALRGLELGRRGRIASAGEILDELRVERTFSVAKAGLRVHFDLNQASLDPAGRRQTDELGKALRQRRQEARGETFLILGHTDRQCPRARSREICDRYNLELSERRAATVRRVLTRELGLPPDRVRAVGCGRGHLLSREISEEDHYLNRRVVVMALESPVDGQPELCGHDSGLL